MFNIIPQPNEIIIKSNKKGFFLTEDTTITKIPFIIDEFRDFIKKAFDIRIHREEKNENCILLSISDEIEHDEGYKIVCEETLVHIYAKTNCGLYYGLQTLKQMLLQGFGKLPALEINDKPLYSYRAFMLDSGRYYQSVKDIKRLIDLMSYHKLNVFHWHLTEDQGWRVEIKKYPELTVKGQKRSHTNFGVKSEEGFYTQEQIKEIVKYCHDRFIKVIPEFDIPGHTVAAIACYPYLSCFDRKLDVATHWGVKHDVLCAGKESTYKFVFDVIDELTELFDDKLIHIGGDEVLKMRWKLCEHCQSLMKREGLANEDELQQYFMNRVNDYIKSKGFTSIMWNCGKNDITSMLDKDIIWQAYGFKDNKDILREEYASGRKIINSDSIPYYLDLPYSMCSLKKIYEYEPELPDVHIMGIEAPIWTEYIPNRSTMDKRVFPRIAAFCEIAWSDVSDRNYDRFSAGLNEYFDYLNHYSVRYVMLSTVNPSVVKGFRQTLWFNRRVLHWQGLHNLIDDKRVKKDNKK